MMLKFKAETVTAIWQFVSMVKSQYNATIKEFMSDTGGEFKSHKVDELIKNLGIESLTSVPYVHQQNGCAEWFNQTIMDKTQTLCLDACIPQSWWEFCVLHALHLYNCMPMQRLEYSTPFELLNGNKPDISHFQVFGCGAYIIIPEEWCLNKLALKSELMTFIG